MSRSLRESLSRFRGFSRNAWLYLISNTIQAFSAGAIGVIYTLFLKSLGYGLTFIGVTLFVATAGGAMAILPASALPPLRLADDADLVQFYWRRGDLLQLIAPTRVVILITSLGIGASLAIFLVLNSPFLAANSGPDQRNAIFGLSNALGWLAAVTGALLGGLLPIWLAALEAPGGPTGPLAALAPALAPARPLLLANPEARVLSGGDAARWRGRHPLDHPGFMLRDMPKPPLASRQRTPAPAARRPSAHG